MADPVLDVSEEDILEDLNRTRLPRLHRVFRRMHNLIRNYSVKSKARPHPGLLPRGEGESFAAFLECRAAEIAGALSSKQETDDAIRSPGGEGQCALPLN